jgi:Predicted membrane protein
MVEDMGWWAVGICTLIMFTFYGIEGIASQLEDPFGYDRNDIKMDAIVLDTKTELEVILAEWRKTTVAAEIAAKMSPSSATSQTNGEKKKFVQPDMFVRARPNTSFLRSNLSSPDLQQ